MIATLCSDPPAELVQIALHAAARDSITAMAVLPADYQWRLRAVGDLMICGIFASGTETEEEWQATAVQGLVVAGASGELVQKITRNYLTNRYIVGKVVSLGYLRDAVAVKGLIYGKNKTELADEVAFLGGVIERAQANIAA